MTQLLLEAKAASKSLQNELITACENGSLKKVKEVIRTLEILNTLVFLHLSMNKKKIRCIVQCME